MSTILTKRQERFIDEYMKDFNGTQASIRAGYSPKGARTNGVRMLTNANITAEIDRRIAEHKQMIERVLMKEAETAKNTMLAILNDPEASDRTKVAIAKDILDRAGFKAPEKQEMSLQGTMSHEVKNVEERLEKYEQVYSKVYELEESASQKESDLTGDDTGE